VLSDPTHEEHAERGEWLGAGFDPERFDLIAINRALARTLTEINPGIGHSV